MRIFYALIIAPVAVLALWYLMPVFKIMMIDVTTSWGATVGLEGIALLICNAMPLIVPVMCVSVIIASFIAAARASRAG